jgi:hypothetical protein
MVWQIGVSPMRFKISFILPSNTIFAKMNSAKILFVLFIITLSACKKEWEQPVVYTANLSLAVPPDSVDADKVYYYSNGMKLQLRLEVISGGSVIYDDAWTDRTNYHWDETQENTSITGKVVNLSGDTSHHIENYPFIMRIFEDSRLLFEEADVVNSYTL